MDDPEEFRATSRDRWEAAARGWSARREAFQSAAAPVSAWLVDAVQPQPGQTVLELAAGPGDTGLLAAERVRPDGKLILTDGAEAMVEVARARTEELGLNRRRRDPGDGARVDRPPHRVGGRRPVPLGLHAARRP